MAAMNINYTLPRGQKCQSFHIQKFVRYRKYEEEKNNNKITLQVKFKIHVVQKQMQILKLTILWAGGMFTS